jgi:hypothetical protein
MPASVVANVINHQWAAKIRANMAAAHARAKGFKLVHTTVTCVADGGDVYSCTGTYVITYYAMHIKMRVPIDVSGPLLYWHTVGTPKLVRVW